MQFALQQKEVRAYIMLTCLVICGLAASTVTAAKVVHFGINFPFSNIIFSIFTYPIVDCICELWGKTIARQTVWLSLGCQFLIMLMIQASIAASPAAFWTAQNEYQAVLATSHNIVFSSLLASAKPTRQDLTETKRLLGYMPQYSLKNALADLAKYGEEGPPVKFD